MVRKRVFPSAIQQRRYMTRDDETRLRRPDGHHAHPIVPDLADAFVRSRLGRRTFLQEVCRVGVSAGVAGGFLTAMTGVAPAAVVSGSESKVEKPRRGGELRWSMPVREITDPATFPVEDESNITRHLVEYLTWTDADNITHPYLAESWEVSEDLRIWTFHLRRGVTWSNGDAFTADDVAFNVRRWLDVNTASSNRTLFASMLERDDQGNEYAPKGAVEVLDSHTVCLHMVRSDAAIPENFFNYPTAILHRRFEEEGGDLAANPVGTGPYRLDHIRVGESARLVRRDAPYWGRAPYLDAIRFVDHGSEATTALAALVSDQVDLVQHVDPRQATLLEGRDSLHRVGVDAADTSVARMRVDKPPFNDIRVRQALTACADRSRLLTIGYGGHGQVAEDHHVAPVHPDYAPLPKLERDPERARSLLREAGHPNGLDIGIAVGNTTGKWEVETIQVLREQLAPAGIRLAIETMPASRYWDIWKDVPFGFTAWLHRPLGIMVPNLAYRSGGTWNETRYANPRFDAALDAANAELDPDARSQKMERVERILQNDAVILQPLWRRPYSGIAERVQGFKRHPSGYALTHGIWLSG